MVGQEQNESSQWQWVKLPIGTFSSLRRASASCFAPCTYVRLSLTARNWHVACLVSLEITQPMVHGKEHGRRERS